MNAAFQTRSEDGGNCLSCAALRTSIHWWRLVVTSLVWRVRSATMEKGVGKDLRNPEDNRCCLTVRVEMVGTDPRACPLFGASKTVGSNIPHL